MVYCCVNTMILLHYYQNVHCDLKRGCMHWWKTKVYVKRESCVSFLCTLTQDTAVHELAEFKALLTSRCDMPLD